MFEVCLSHIFDDTLYDYLICFPRNKMYILLNAFKLTTFIGNLRNLLHYCIAFCLISGLILCIILYNINRIVNHFVFGISEFVT